jgi:hypothetical protein
VLIPRRSIAAVAVVAAALAGTMGAASAAASHGRPVYIQLGRLHGGRELVRLDPDTFEPLGKPVVQLDDSTDGRAISPDRQKFAFVGIEQGRVYVVDMARFTKLRTIQVLHGKRNSKPQLVVEAWPRRHVLVGYAERFHAHESNPARLVIVDPTKPHQVRLLPLGGSVLLARHTRDGHAVFIVAPANRVAPARLVVVNRRGRVHSVTLGRIRAGFVDSGEQPSSQDLEPGLAVNDTRALVVGLHQTIASVNLHSLAVGYHRIPHLLQTRLPEPPPSDEGSDGGLHGIARGATLLGHHELLVTGGEEDPLAHRAKVQDVRRAATIVGLRRWRVRHVFDHVADLSRLGSLYVGSPQGHDEFAQPKVIDVFGHDGSLIHSIRLHHNRSWRIIDNQLIVGGLGNYGASAVEVNPRTGRTIRTLAKGSKWQDKIAIWTP